MFFKVVIAFLTFPGIIGILFPILIAKYDPWKGSVISTGLFVVFVGIIIILWCVRDFYVSGKGTLAPYDPPKKLIVIGLYRFVRNPMYIGVIFAVFGWSIFYASPLLALYATILVVSFHIRVMKYEEPHLKEQFGDEWELYSQKVPRWFVVL